MSCARLSSDDYTVAKFQWNGLDGFITLCSLGAIFGTPLPLSWYPLPLTLHVQCTLSLGSHNILCLHVHLLRGGEREEFVSTSK